MSWFRRRNPVEQFQSYLDEVGMILQRYHNVLLTDQELDPICEMCATFYANRTSANQAASYTAQLIQNFRSRHDEWRPATPGHK